MSAIFENVVVVTRQTELQELVRRFNTVPQARFYLEQAGHSFDAIEAAHRRHETVLDTVIAAVPRKTKHQVIDRERVPQFLFGDDDLVVTVGQDGLVSNTAKYLSGQPILAVNPDPGRYDGVLLPFTVKNFAGPLAHALEGDMRTRKVSLALATSSNNQSLLAFNDFYIGARSHVSARYEIEVGGRTEFQSSSGMIVSTGAGSTGWLQSVFAGAVGVVEALGGRVVPPPDNGRIPWDTDQLVYSVREPFPSQTTRCSIVHGRFGNDSPLRVTSHMPANGVIFSDGVESDSIDFNTGTSVAITIAPKSAQLIVGAA